MAPNTDAPPLFSSQVTLRETFTFKHLMIRVIFIVTGFHVHGDG